ncbi:MAG TPA: DUF1549 and DUF1553 domain-containing protein [Planctomycetaceae bacterium]|nr:DUF1549 and DUF1553 domain-containing protein [Planctomycetaceae bacterium]
MVNIKRRISRVALLFALLSAATAERTWASSQDDAVAGAITVYPASIELRHPRRPHSLQVLGTSSDGYSLDLLPASRLVSADPKIAKVDEQGWVSAVSNGQTQITVSAAGQVVSVPVKVELPAAEPPYSFRHEVMTVLSKSGCNMGACHGYSLGKNGFKLSLRGSDPELDFAAITKEQFGRRLNLQFPETSLIVAKPRGDAPHEGGVRFRRSSLANEIMVNWIQQGAPGDLADPARVVAVRLVPDKLMLRPRQKHRVQMIAIYNDGTTRDVTRLGAFSVNNTQFAEVDDEGQVVAGDAGETAIAGRFERTFGAAGVIVLKPNPDFVPTPLPEGNLIDRPVVEKLNRLKIAPSAIAGDEEFLRRVYLDLIGMQPKPDEIKAFVSDGNPAKREQVVDKLFGRSEFVDHWSLKWGDLLQNSRNVVSQQSVYLFREFLRSAIAENMPLDQFARRIFTSRGGIVDDPASVYFAISKDTNDTLERATQVFCGVRMLCARCHPHPLENWTQRDYYGLASFFSQVSTRPDVRFPGVANAKLVQMNLAAGSATNPRTGRPQPARYLAGQEPEIPEGTDRREVYAQWLTSPDNPFFARGLVNRIWSYFFHRGIVDPVDDIRSTNPPINPALLEALTRDFIEHRFDMRQLMRRIVTSATYQRTSLATQSNRRDEQNFSHAIPRRIPAEALLDSLVQATGIPESFPGAPGGFHAAQLPDAAFDSPFLSLFGKPQRMDACECERDNSSNMLQALHFINGKSILGRVQNAAARPAQLMGAKLADEPLVTELYLWSLARHPTADELRLGVEFFKSYGDKRSEAAQDLMWALLNSRDFLLVN